MKSKGRSGAIWLWVAVLSLSPLTRASAQDEDAKRKAGLDFYGFVMVDAIFDHTGIEGDWLGAARPTRLPAFEDEFGGPGQFFFGVKQTRFGLKAHAPTKLGEATAVLDFDFFGVGVDAGQTIPRLRNAYIELGQFLMASCLKPMPATPAERLDAAADRLTAVIFAASNLNMALNDFTSQLSDEQKTRLNSMVR